MTSKFVTRAGDKLERAIKEFNIDVSDKVCAGRKPEAEVLLMCYCREGLKEFTQ